MPTPAHLTAKLTHRRAHLSTIVNNLTALKNSTKWKFQPCIFHPVPARLPPARTDKACFVRFSVKDKVVLVTGGAKGKFCDGPHSLPRESGA